MRIQSLAFLALFAWVSVCAESGNKFLLPPAAADGNELLASFKNRCDEYGNGNKGFCYRYGSVILYVHFQDALPEELTAEEKALFTRSEQTIEGAQRVVYHYEFGTLPGVRHTPSSHNLPYLPRTFAEEPAACKTLSIQECARLIADKKVVFFTGAGISAAAGIHTLATLNDQLGIQSHAAVDLFVLAALHNPEQLVNQALDFYRACRDHSPTPAHYSLARLSKSKGCQIVTGNFDLLHERSGIKPYRVFYESHYVADLKAEWLREIDAVICIGMSNDIGSFLSAYKTHHPEGIIVAVDLKRPLFIGAADYFLEGDLQEIVPAMERAFWGLQPK